MNGIILPTHCPICQTEMIRATKNHPARCDVDPSNNGIGHFYHSVSTTYFDISLFIDGVLYMLVANASRVNSSTTYIQRLPDGKMMSEIDIDFLYPEKDTVNECTEFIRKMLALKVFV